MFIRLNYTKDFKVKRGKTYNPRPEWHLETEEYIFNSEGIVGYKVLYNVPIYKKVSNTVTAKGWFKTTKEVESYEYNGTKTLYMYYRFRDGYSGVPDHISTFALDTLVLGETND